MSIQRDRPLLELCELHSKKPTPILGRRRPPFTKLKRILRERIAELESIAQFGVNR